MCEQTDSTSSSSSSSSSGFQPAALLSFYVGKGSVSFYFFSLPGSLILEQLLQKRWWNFIIIVFSMENIQLPTLKYSCGTDYRQGPLVHLLKKSPVHVGSLLCLDRIFCFRSRDIFVLVNSRPRIGHRLAAGFVFYFSLYFRVVLIFTPYLKLGGRFVAPEPTGWAASSSRTRFQLRQLQLTIVQIYSGGFSFFFLFSIWFHQFSFCRNNLQEASEYKTNVFFF